MTKIFEDFFSELQADMVSICLEYVSDRADKIYIYCSYEEGMISSDFFYCINNKVVERHKLNDVLSSAEKDVFVYDVSVERQRGVIKIINNDIEEIFHLCKKHGREMPTEMKIIYDVKLNKLTANYNYELVHTNHPVKTADDISMEWFEQIQAEKSY
ncbi:hypothetical protein AV545_22125 [Paenibacillus jamilae]|uniref:hypothetical protein n=1 Tax=Paenibacillus jamilae TaxID=114136 RepID=UPI0007AC06A3|nr:hypothetical protein [Paenibacillus jamilae]KZE69569.1 hypothetical protein AV545_22125 [Paenibacillus jamilae]